MTRLRLNMLLSLRGADGAIPARSSSRFKEPPSGSKLEGGAA